MRCESCGSEELTTVSVALTEAMVLNFKSCSYCDTKKWETRDREISLHEVLELTASNRPR